MSSVREQVIQVLDALPDDATLDDVMAELHFRMRVEQGLNDLDEGRWIPQEEVEKRMAKWLDSPRHSDISELRSPLVRRGVEAQFLLRGWRWSRLGDYRQ